MYSPERTLPEVQTLGARLGVLVTGDKYHPSSTLDKLMREHEGDKPCSEQNTLPGACDKSDKTLEGRVVRGSAYAVCPRRKNMFVMSQWVHTSGRARVLRQLLPVLLLWQPSQPSRKKLKEGAPVLCARLLSFVWSTEMTGRQAVEHG